MSRRRRARAALAAALLAVLALGAAAAPQNDNQKLSALRARIRRLTDKLDAQRSRHDSMTAELRDTELRLAGLRGELADLDKRLADTRVALAGLAAEHARQNRKLAAERATLARLVRSSYVLMRQNYLQILLNERDPYALSRVRAFYGYVSRARARDIEELRSQIEAIVRLEAQTATQRVQMETLQAQRAKRVAKLESRRRERTALLARMAAEIAHRGARLARLKSDEKRLADLVSGLHDIADVPARAAGALPFASLKGRMAWPTGGVLRHAFGTPRGQSNLRWQGDWIGAPRGEPVRAIAHGQVVFANWLRGFGLLLIIDHGGGYMSLYGHDETLRKETGDWVNAGDVVATVGDSGGDDATGLYFEIRHQGTPRDPAAWLAGRVPPAAGTLVSGR